MHHQHNARNRGRSNPQSPALQKVNVATDTDDDGEEESKVHGNAKSWSWRLVMLSRPIMALRKRINNRMSSVLPSWCWLAIISFVFLYWMSRSSFLDGMTPGLRYSPLNTHDNIFPRCVRHLMIDDEYYLTQRLGGVNSSTETISYKFKSRDVFVSKRAKKSQEELENSEEYADRRCDTFETKHCKAQYPWQLSPGSPTCNSIHESDLNDLHAHKHRKVRLLGHGYRRDVWMVLDVDGTQQILKTQRYKHDFSEYHQDLHRLDAIIMERLTKSPLVLDIYGFCGSSGYFEHASGDMAQTVWPKEHTVANLTSLYKLQIATQAAMGLADLHNVDKEGRSSIAHTDISPEQFVLVGDLFKLNDFNRASLLRWNIKHNRVCPYHVGMNGGKIRSPEEYMFEGQTEKVDVFALGNVFYVLLTGMSPFDNEHEEAAIKKVMDGVRPPFSEAIMKSPDPIVQALKKAMFYCHEQDPKRRIGARHVANLLKEELLKWDPDALRRWGLQ